MRNLIAKTSLLIAFLVLFAGKVNAAVLDSQFIMEKVKKSVEEKVKPMVKGEVLIESSGIRTKSLEVPDGKVEIATILNMPSFTPFTVARVNVLVNGKITKTFGVPLKITVYDYVWVSKETINRDSSLTHSNIALEKKELGLMSEHAIRSDFPVYDCRARKTFRPGDIIDIRYIDSVPAVIKNNPVSVVFQNSDIQITVTALALENGKIGDYIKVRSVQFKKEYIGKVISSSAVLIEI